MTLLTLRGYRMRSSTVILIGFATILLLLATLFIVRISTVAKEADTLETLRSEYLKKELVFKMRDAAHIRAKTLYQLARTTDPIKRQELSESLQDMAATFVSARTQLLAMDLQPSQRAAWERAQPRAVAGRQAQERATALILAGEIAAADKLLQDEVVPTQEAVMAELTTMLEFSTSRVNGLLDEAKHEQQRKLRLAMVLASVAFLIGTLITFLVVRTTSRSEAEQLRAREAAQKANGQKSIFLANMSHELRTPLNAILGYSEMLSEDACAVGHETMAADSKKINAAGKHLLNLINDILDLAKIEAGKMQLYLDEFEVAQLVTEVAATIEPLVVKNGSVLQLHNATDLGSMRADMTKVRQALLNLLGNAAKFTSDGHITLTSSRAKRGSRDWIILQVADTGIGMSDEELGRLFQDFSQGDASTTRKYGGTGLGLSISKRFCKMMGGDLSAISAVGVGSEFTIELPAEVLALRDEVDSNAPKTGPTIGVVK